MYNTFIGHFILSYQFVLHGKHFVLLFGKYFLIDFLIYSHDLCIVLNSGDSPLLGTKIGHCIRESSVSPETHTDPRARGPQEKSSPSCPVLPRLSIPLCWRSWFSSSGQGFHTSVALCVSWARAETSWSSGISAWNRKPMLMRL